MSEIIDLGNGYGCIDKYRSDYARLTFPFTKYEILRLYALEVITREQAASELLKMGYELPAVKWAVGVASITTEQWRKAVERARTI